MLPFIIILTFCCTISTKNLHQLSCTPARRRRRSKRAAAAGNTTIRSSLCTVRARGARHRRVSFAHVLVVLAAAAVAASEHFYTRVCFLCRPHGSCHCWHILFSTFLSRYFIRLNWCVSFCFLFSFFSFSFIHCRRSCSLLCRFLALSLYLFPHICVPITLNIHTIGSYTQHIRASTFLLNVRQRSIALFGSVQFSSVWFSSAWIRWYLCLVFTIPPCVCVSALICMRACFVGVNVCLPCMSVRMCVSGVVHSAMCV